MKTPNKTAAAPAPIRLYNRETGRIEPETIVGHQFMNFTFGTTLGRRLTETVLIRPLVSRLYGWWQQHPTSRRSIPPFIRQFGINMDEVKIPETGFACFNDFFIRHLKPEARPIPQDPKVLISPADGRIKCFPVEEGTRLAIKGSDLGLDEILGNETSGDEFIGGTGVQVRLAPVDYHRFGYIDNGVHGQIRSISGPLHSVSPLALSVWPKIWAQNKRHWCRIETDFFGPVIQVEVGAMMVGSVIQQKPQGGPCRRGQEKGYFALGGSTVLLFFTPGTVEMDDDIREHSRNDVETLVKYGEVIGRVPE